MESVNAKAMLESGGYTCVLTDGTAVYTSTLRGVKPLVQFLESRTIHVQYGKKVLNIINRMGDGICPFEAAVMGITDPVAAYHAILHKMQEMNITI